MRIKPMLTTIAIAGALVGGGAALADAASSSKSAPNGPATTPTTGAQDTNTTQSTPEPPAGAPARRPAYGAAPRFHDGPPNGHHCPHMGAGSGSSSQGSFNQGPAPGFVPGT